MNFKKGGDGNNKKRNQKQYYKAKFQSSKKAEELKHGIAGFLVTCDQNKEKRCVKEVFNVLNDYVEKFYPDLNYEEILKDRHVKDVPAEDELDQPLKEEKKEEENKPVRIDDAIREEMNKMRKTRIFFIFETGTTGIVFIKMLDEMKPHIDLNRIGLAIIEHVKETKQPLCRFAFRLIPVDVLCKAKIEDFKTLAPAVIKKYFSAEEGEADLGVKSWCMEFKKSNNNSINKRDFLDFLFNEINGHRNPVDLKDGDLSVIIEVLRDLLVFAVVPKYKENKKFNLQQLCLEEEAPRVVKVSDLLGKRDQPEDKADLDQQVAKDINQESEGESSEGEADIKLI